MAKKKQTKKQPKKLVPTSQTCITKCESRRRCNVQITRQ